MTIFDIDPVPLKLACLIYDIGHGLTRFNNFIFWNIFFHLVIQQ
jgi:hypothetical protein